MLTEWATYDELKPALHEAMMYGYDCVRNRRVQRAMRKGAKDLFYGVNTAMSKLPVLYWIKNDKKGTFFTFLVLEGSEANSYAIETTRDSKHCIFVIHGHAISRYRERSKFEGTIEQACVKVLTELMLCMPVNDSDTTYISFDGGVFLCNVTNRVLHIRTFITYRQCKPNQRLWMYKSGKELEDLLKEIQKTYD